MKALILAAGMGNRLKQHTADKPKCMVEVKGASVLITPDGQFSH